VKAGATTQDVTDSATVFQIRASFDIIANKLDEAIAATANLTRDHRDLPMAGRSNLQQAVPIDLRTTHHRDESPAVVNDKLFRKWRPCRTL
jgi:adenylosuccinate lyase